MYFIFVTFIHLLLFILMILLDFKFLCKTLLHPLQCFSPSPWSWYLRSLSILTNISMCVYHGSGPLLVFLAIVVSAVADALLFRPGKLRPAQHLHSQPVVNHLCTPLTICQAHLSCTLQEHTHKNHYFSLDISWSVLSNLYDEALYYYFKRTKSVLLYDSFIIHH